jgi:hypothetical protein
MAEESEMIKVHPNSELGHLLAQADEKPLLVEKGGVRYAIYRADNAEPLNMLAYTARDEREVRSPVNSRLADGYQSIPALEKTKTWKEVEEIIQQERAAHYAAKGV